MILKPREQRGFVEDERFGAVKMAAVDLPRRAAGMENARSFDGGDAGDLVGLESGGRKRGNLAAMLDRLRPGHSPLAQLAVNGHALALKREDFQRKAIELLLAARKIRRETSAHKRAHL